MELMKKQFKFKGKSLEELKEMDVREFANLLKSRRKRTILRQFQKIEDFVNRSKTKISKNKQVKTHYRDIIVVPHMVGMRIGVYNGQNFVQVNITGEMLGHVLGEFAPTRARVKHGSSGVGGTKGTRAKAKH